MDFTAEQINKDVLTWLKRKFPINSVWALNTPRGSRVKVTGYRKNPPHVPLVELEGRIIEVDPEVLKKPVK